MQDDDVPCEPFVCPPEETMELGEGLMRPVEEKPTLRQLIDEIKDKQAAEDHRYHHRPNTPKSKRPVKVVRAVPALGNPQSTLGHAPRPRKRR